MMFPLLWFSFVACSSAYDLSIKRVRPSPVLQTRALRSPADLQINVDQNLAETSFDLNSVHDLIYIANITVGSNEYPVQLDTGSSDLFIHGTTSPLPGTQGTNLSYNLTYAIGWASGHVAYGPIEFVGNTVPSQVFLDATSVKNPALTYGAAGIAGLGFNRLSSLDMVINNTNAATGRSLLYNLFAANLSTPNFIAFALQRGTQPDDDVDGSFSIGEYDPKYIQISGSNRISTWPIRNPYRWNVLVDAVIVNNSIVVPSTRVTGAPGNKAVALMDSGSSYSYAPKGVCDAIYSGIPGASFDQSLGYWKVPCSYEINIALQIAGEIYPIHPLDVNPRSSLEPSACIGSFVPQQFAIGTDFDWIVGDNFLRSVYSVYDFGDFDSSGIMGDPYMKLLSIVDPDEASVEFHKLRGGTPKTNITFIGLDGASIAPSFSISNDISQSLELIGKFIPAMLGIVALNALVVIVCCVVWLISFCRRGKIKNVMARTPRSRLSPIRMNSRNSYIAGVADPSVISRHAYEPVSMALTDDTFVPPSPAFHRFEKTKGKGEQTYDPVPSPSDDSFVPPSPAFHRYQNNRTSVMENNRVSLADTASLRDNRISMADSSRALLPPSPGPLMQETEIDNNGFATDQDDPQIQEPTFAPEGTLPMTNIVTIQGSNTMPADGAFAPTSSPYSQESFFVPTEAPPGSHPVFNNMNYFPANTTNLTPPGPAVLHMSSNVNPGYLLPHRSSQRFDSRRDVDLEDRPRSIA